MASDGQPVQIPATSLVHGSQAPTTVKIQQGGKTVPQSGKDTQVVSSAAASAAAAAKAAADDPTATAPKNEVTAQVALLNKFLNDSGRPVQFRPSQDDKSIQEINPANGAVIAEYSAAEFAALARSVGITGALINERV
jgi:hypothetical protein